MTYSPEEDNPTNRAFRQAYEAQAQKLPPQFSAQAFTSIQVMVKALKNPDMSTLSSEQHREQLNKAILSGTYLTPLGEISFTPSGEINQKRFYVAQIKMTAEGGKFEFLP